MIVVGEADSTTVAAGSLAVMLVVCSGVIPLDTTLEAEAAAVAYDRPVEDGTACCSASTRSTFGVAAEFEPLEADLVIVELRYGATGRDGKVIEAEEEVVVAEES